MPDYLRVRSNQTPRTPASLEHVVESQGAALQRLALVYARDAADAQDLFQDICYAIWRALPSFREESSLRTFVFRIAHNRGLSHRSRRAIASLDLTSAVSVADPAPSPAGIADASLRRDRLLQGIRTLTETQREVLLLSLEGLTQREIGDVLGIAENAVAVRLTRARQSLRRVLRQEEMIDVSD